MAKRMPCKRTGASRRFIGEQLECTGPGPAEYIQLSDACNFLEHYHLEHTRNKATRFRGKDKGMGGSCDILVVSDPEIKDTLRRLLKPYFEED